jgi:soluble lytic murein transglycosylase-like protein
MIPSVAEAAGSLATQAPAAQQPAQAPAPSGGGGGHYVQPGETLSGIAAQLGVNQSALASANGLAFDGWVISGTTLKLPTASASAVAGPPPMGAYTVRPGDSLSGIAASAGVAREQIAFMNGLDPNGMVLIGTVLKLPTGASGPQPNAPVPAQRVVPTAGPAPTSEFVSSQQIGQIAAQHGVSPSLATAIAYQESGFNNRMVSSANARGVMQIMPGTWEWINQNLSPNPLNPNSALDNVQAGVLYLKQLVRDFGGDENAAAAAYYQGAGAVRSRGLFDDTKQYVNSVNALRPRFGG